jgi:hypothetical protein
MCRSTNGLGNGNVFHMDLRVRHKSGLGAIDRVHVVVGADSGDRHVDKMWSSTVCGEKNDVEFGFLSSHVKNCNHGQPDRNQWWYKVTHDVLLDLKSFEEEGQKLPGLSKPESRS